MSKLKHCTVEECERALQYVTDLIVLLGLPHHWVKISSRPSPKDTMAMIDHEQQRYLATIYLGRSWHTDTEFEQFHSLTHEVCHMLHRRVETAVRRTEGFVHDHEWDQLWEGVRVELELQTDMLALALCNLDQVKAYWYRAEPNTGTEGGEVTVDAK